VSVRDAHGRPKQSEILCSRVLRGAKRCLQPTRPWFPGVKGAARCRDLGSGILDLGISQVSPRSLWSPRDCHEFCTHAPAGAERVEDPRCEMPSAIRIFQPAGGNSQETSLAPLAGQTPDGDITISASSLLSAASCLGLRVSHGLMIRPAAKNHSNPPRFTLLATSKRHPTDFAKILDFQARVKPPSTETRRGSFHSVSST
jgi:hypothetical protein